MKIASFVAVSRPGCKFKNFSRGEVRFIEMPLLEISSTMIRDRVRQRKPIEAFLAPAVADYIRNKGLYRDEE